MLLPLGSTPLVKNIYENITKTPYLSFWEKFISFKQENSLYNLDSAAHGKPIIHIKPYARFKLECVTKIGSNILSSIYTKRKSIHNRIRYYLISK
jgi:hypothetical protein